MNLEAFVLGCGGMMPLPYRHLTSVLLRREGDLFLFDGGEGTQVSLRRLNLKWKKINAIFVSHTHADHVTGIPGILMLSAQVDRDEPLYIYGPPKIAEYIETSRKVLDMYINYPIVVKEITAPCVVHEGDGFYIRAFPLQHTKTCVGYTLEELNRPGEFNPEKARALNVPVGPLWSKLQSGESVLSADGKTVTMKKVKITILKTTLQDDLAKEYGIEGLSTCPLMSEGEIYYADYAKPEGFCDEAWKAIYQYVFALAHGVSEIWYYSDWIKTHGVAIVSCNDGLRPVIMKLEATDIEASPED